MGHWYTKEGEAMHWIEGANGKQRDTTLRDAKKLGLLPSVTTILGLLNKPGLNNWYQKQYIMAALTLPKKEGESLDDFARRIPRDAMQQADDARDIGGEIHDCLEAIVKRRVLGKKFTKVYPDDVLLIATTAWAEICKYCETEAFIAEQTVAGDGYGGMIDLWADETDESPAIIVDWKTKDITDINAKLHWPEMAMQLAAYEHAMTKHGQGFKVKQPTRHINVFIDRTEPGKIVIHEWEPEEIELAWQKFELLLKYWQLDKNHGAE